MGQGPYGPGPIWAKAHMGQGPYGPRPIWARAHMGQGPYGPGPIWARAHMGRAHMGQGPYEPRPIWARAIWARAHWAPGPYGPGPIGPRALPCWANTSPKNAPWKKKSSNCIFSVFLGNKKDARHPYDHFGGGIAPRSLLCVRKRRFPLLKKDIIWFVLCPRNLLPGPRNLLPGKCSSYPTSICAGGQDDVSSQVNSLKKTSKCLVLHWICLISPYFPTLCHWPICPCGAGQPLKSLWHQFQDPFSTPTWCEGRHLV